MKLILHLLVKDLRRDCKRPLGLLILMVIPFLTALLVASVFGQGEGVEENIVLRVAVLDREDDVLTQMLRGSANQGDAGEQLNLTFVDTYEQGIQELENRRVSAFVVFPDNFTNDLIDGATAEITIYKNPAEQVLPNVIEQGIDMVAAVISIAFDQFDTQLKAVIDLFEQDEFPNPWQTGMLVYTTMQKLESAEPYYFPPLIGIDNEDASEYVKKRFPDTNDPDSGEGP